MDKDVWSSRVPKWSNQHNSDAVQATMCVWIFVWLKYCCWTKRPAELHLNLICMAMRCQLWISCTQDSDWTNTNLKNVTSLNLWLTAHGHRLQCSAVPRRLCLSSIRHRSFSHVSVCEQTFITEHESEMMCVSSQSRCKWLQIALFYYEVCRSFNKSHKMSLSGYWRLLWITQAAVWSNKLHHWVEPHTTHFGQ